MDNVKVAVGSTQLAKVQAVKHVVHAMKLEVVAHSVPSSVSDQPMSDRATMEGALHRARTVLNKTGCDIGIGLEGGMMQMGDTLFVCNWGALVCAGHVEIVTGGLRLPLPRKMGEELLRGKELSEVIAKNTDRGANSQQKSGALGLLTNGFVSRTDTYIQIVNALFGQYQYVRKRF